MGRLWSSIPPAPAQPAHTYVCDPLPAVHRGRHPHLRANLLQPATPVPPRKGALTRVPGGQTLARRGPGAASRPQVWRGGDAAKLAIHSMGSAAADGSPLRCAPSAFMNGGGCAAS